MSEPASVDAPVRQDHQPMTAADLREVSGYQTPSKQAQWVRSQLSINPAIRSDGRPSLTWGVYTRALLARRAGATVAGDASEEEAPPNWDKPFKKTR